MNILSKTFCMLAILGLTGCGGSDDTVVVPPVVVPPVVVPPVVVPPVVVPPVVVPPIVGLKSPSSINLVD